MYRGLNAVSALFRGIAAQATKRNNISTVHMLAKASQDLLAMRCVVLWTGMPDHIWIQHIHHEFPIQALGAFRSPEREMGSLGVALTVCIPILFIACALAVSC